MSILFSPQNPIPDDHLVFDMFCRVVARSETDKDLLSIPVEQGTEISINVEVDFDKVLNVSIHMPCCFSSHDVELVDGEVAGGLIARCEG